MGATDSYEIGLERFDGAEHLAGPEHPYASRAALGRAQDVSGKELLAYASVSC